MNNIKWTFEKCKKEAKKYSTKIEFKNKSPSAYVIANRKKWMKDISAHMKSVGNKYFRCIYSYEFSDNHVYVGLTFNLDERSSSRKFCKTDAVTKHSNKTKLVPKKKQLTKYVSVEKAKKLEEYYLIKYKKINWNILNKAPAGGIGGNTLFWDKEKCVAAAKSCKTRTEFNKKYRGAYSSSVKNKWIDSIYKILKSNKGKRNRKYTKDSCREKALLFNTKRDFKKYSKGEFSAAYKNGWLDEIAQHMKRPVKWTKEFAFEKSKECKNRNEFKTKYKGGYHASLKNNWLNEFFIKDNKK